VEALHRLGPRVLHEFLVELRQTSRSRGRPRPPARTIRGARPRDPARRWRRSLSGETASPRR
jgi:hypothetical protein